MCVLKTQENLSQKNVLQYYQECYLNLQNHCIKSCCVYLTVFCNTIHDYCTLLEINLVDGLLIQIFFIQQATSRTAIDKIVTV